MRVVTTTLLLAGAALAIAACRDNQGEQNITVTENIPANADIEALPPDETVAPANELDNTAAPDTNDVNATTNSY